MPSDASVAPPDGGLQQPIDLSLSRRDSNGNRNGNENHNETEEPLNLCVPNNRRHVVRCSNSRSQRRKRRRLERMVSHLRKCSNSSNLAPNAAPSCGEDEEQQRYDDVDEDNDDAGDDESDEEGKVGGASIRNPLLARTLGGLLAAVPNWPSGGATSYIPRSFYSNCGQSRASPSTVAASLPLPVGGAQAPRLSSSSCSPPSSPSPPPTLSQLQDGPSVALMTANAAGSRKRTQRALTGKHVKQGTGASPATLLTLRHKIEQRRQQQRGVGHTRQRGGVGFHDGGATSRSISAKKNGATVAQTSRKKKLI